MATKRKRKIGLGSGDIAHVQGARVAHRRAMQTFDRALAAIKHNECEAALENMVVGNNDYGEFLSEIRHGVGNHGRKGPAAAPRMRQAVSNKRMEVLQAFSKACVLK